MEYLLTHIIANDKARMLCHNVHINESFINELSSTSENNRSIRIYIDLIKLFLLCREEKHSIPIASIEDLYRNLEKRIIPESKQESEHSDDSIRKSLLFLNNLKSAVEHFFEDNKSEIRHLKQSDILKYFKNENGTSIKQAGLSLKINRGLEVHRFVLAKNIEEFGILTKTIVPFRNMNFNSDLRV